MVINVGTRIDDVKGGTRGCQPQAAQHRGAVFWPLAGSGRMRRRRWPACRHRPWVPWTEEAVRPERRGVACARAPAAGSPRRQRMQLGQKLRRLQEKGTTRLALHSAQRRRKEPWPSMPQSRKARRSRSPYHGSALGAQFPQERPQPILPRLPRSAHAESEEQPHPAREMRQPLMSCQAPFPQPGAKALQVPLPFTTQLTASPLSTPLRPAGRRISCRAHIHGMRPLRARVSSEGRLAGANNESSYRTFHLTE